MNGLGPISTSKRAVAMGIASKQALSGGAGVDHKNKSGELVANIRVDGRQIEAHL